MCTPSYYFPLINELPCIVTVLLFIFVRLSVNIFSGTFYLHPSFLPVLGNSHQLQNSDWLFLREVIDELLKQTWSSIFSTPNTSFDISVVADTFIRYCFRSNCSRYMLRSVKSYILRLPSSVQAYHFSLH